VSGELPLGDAFLNRAIEKLLARHPHLAAVVVQSLDGDAVSAQVVPRVRLLPAIRFLVAIERQREFPSDPVLRLRWAMPAVGPLALPATRVVSFFNLMPPGVRVDGNRVFLDLRELLRTHGLEEGFDLIRRAEIHTRSGGVVVRFELGL
jgi:hypothetical protein